MKTMAQIMAEDKRQTKHYQRNIGARFFFRKKTKDERDYADYVVHIMDEPQKMLEFRKKTLKKQRMDRLSLGIISVAK